jgi:para-aminobenzoate synthetase / 4-amino-4-deoxychorismate lyase
MTRSADSLILQNQHQWLQFSHPIAIQVARSPQEVIPLLAAVQQQVDRDQLYAAGWISYEAATAFDPAFTTQDCDRFPAAWFGLYRQPDILHLPPIPTDQRPIELDWQPDLSPSAYQTAIARIKSSIQQGLTYQVNFSFRLRATLPTDFDPWIYFLQLAQAQNGFYGAFIDLPDYAICCASPELFFQQDGQTISCRPMKGTIQRGLSYGSDRQQSQWLQQSAKNQAENLMIVDMIRNDLGRIAEIASVKVTQLFETEQYPTLWQMTSSVQAETRASLPEIIRSLFPCASITGAPKASTMAIIAALESSPRRIYTGTIGYIAPNRKAQFNVAIRTVLIDKQQQQAEYGVGGGIVWDSESHDEYEECCTKAKILTQPSHPFDLLETLLWTPEFGYFLLDFHLERLQQSADYFAIALSLPQVQTRLTEVIATKLAPQKVRLLVSQAGVIHLTTEPFVAPDRNQPVRLAIAQFPIDSRDRYLYHKTTHRQVYQQAQQANPTADDVLLWNERGEITESCLANVVVELEGEWYTPPVVCGLLSGTMRRSLLAQGKVKERVILRSDLVQAGLLKPGLLKPGQPSKLWLVNSVRQVREAIVLQAGDL